MILNLANPEKSEIQFKINRYPDGQQDISLQMLEGRLASIDFTIKSRLNSFRDLELIIAANQALRNETHCERVRLFIPYFLGGRSDRDFHTGGVNYIKQVIAPIINSQNFFDVSVLDPHSDVIEACINNFSKQSNISLVRFALMDLLKYNPDIKPIVVSPDAGAHKKIYDLIPQIKSYVAPYLITASKVRDLETGKIVETKVPIEYYLPNDESFVIIDDICDGGRTFIEIAKAINSQKPNSKIYLIVSHGIFSAGFGELSKYIDRIYTTNSISNTIEEESMNYVKQLNIF